MFSTPSLITRIIVGKAVGLVFGIVGFVAVLVLWPDMSARVAWGVLLWYVTLGAIIGVFGVFDRHPMLRLPMPWWLRAPALGAWMNFLLMLFAWDLMQAMMTALIAGPGWLTSPWWVVVEGAVVGLVIGYCATRVGGEGPETLAADQA